jgi:hypothetical protein
MSGAGVLVGARQGAFVLGPDGRCERQDVSGPSDSGDSWPPVVRDLPAVLSVEVQTLP